MEYTLYKGDCLELFKKIPDSSIDLILCDPPYGIMGGNSGIDKPRYSNRKSLAKIHWDTALDAKTLLKECERVLRPNGKAILFSQEPYTSQLVLSQTKGLQFAYPLYWLKNCPGNSLYAKKCCLQYIEVMCLFRRVVYGDELYANSPARDYLKSELKKANLTVPQVNKLIGCSSMASHYFGNGRQFAIPSRKHYEILQTTGFFQKPYEYLKNTNKEHYPYTFNLNGAKSKSNVFEYAKTLDGFHPTQKPVLLLEDLLKTFSNENDLILDFTMGSGSTGVACMNTNRNFIGIEMNEEYFNTAKSRIDEAFSLHK